MSARKRRHIRATNPFKSVFSLADINGLDKHGPCYSPADVGLVRHNWRGTLHDIAAIPAAKFKRPWGNARYDKEWVIDLLVLEFHGTQYGKFWLACTFPKTNDTRDWVRCIRNAERAMFS